LRAWRGAAGLRDAGAARSWLYSIAANVCLTELEAGAGGCSSTISDRRLRGHTPPGAPIAESAWLEPNPDESIGLPAGRAAPEVTYEQQEGGHAATEHVVSAARRDRDLGS
jgi:DNA-directed RNA polymerase specialized sigma24 family protein